jgi:hypothetical protein
VTRFYAEEGPDEEENTTEAPPDEEGSTRRPGKVKP